MFVLFQRLGGRLDRAIDVVRNVVLVTVRNKERSETSSEFIKKSG